MMREHLKNGKPQFRQTKSHPNDFSPTKAFAIAAGTVLSLSIFGICTTDVRADDDITNSPISGGASDNGACVVSSAENSRIDLTDAEKREQVMNSSTVSGITSSNSGIFLAPSSALDASRIVIPTTGEVKISFLTDQMGGGATTALGYLKYQELIDRGYIIQGSNGQEDRLADTDNNHIPDFHEDLFGIVDYDLCVAHGRTNCGDATTGAFSAPNTYPLSDRHTDNWTATNKCTGSGQTSTFEYEGKTYSLPLIAVKGCDNAFQGTIRTYGTGPAYNASTDQWTNHKSDLTDNNKDFCPKTFATIKTTTCACENDSSKECGEDSDCDMIQDTGTCQEVCLGTYSCSNSSGTSCSMDDGGAACADECIFDSGATGSCYYYYYNGISAGTLNRTCSNDNDCPDITTLNGFKLTKQCVFQTHCSQEPSKVCKQNKDCPGEHNKCISDSQRGHCAGNPSKSCTGNTDCSLGACVCNGDSPKRCSEDTSQSCTRNADCFVTTGTSTCACTTEETPTNQKVDACYVVGENKDYNNLLNSREKLRPGRDRQHFYSDGGLWPRVPNLLEPPDAKNNYRGLGAGIIFHNTTDNASDTWPEALPEAVDMNTFHSWYSGAYTPSNNDYIPNYPVALYDATGRLLSGKSVANSTRNDYVHTKSLGTIASGTELVFFIIGYSNYKNYDGCLDIETTERDGRTYPYCKLAIETSILPMFSKSLLNAEIEHPDKSYTYPRGNVYNRPFSDWVNQKSGSYNMINALVQNHSFEKAKLTGDKSPLVIPYPSNWRANHAMTTAPINYPKYWILSFEDTRRGGDQTYDDVSFVIQKPAGGAVVSTVISQEICPSDESRCDNYVVSTVTLKKSDDITYSCSTTSSSNVNNSYDCQPRPNKCNSTDDANIEYWVTSNCRVWDRTACKSGETAPQCTGSYISLDPEKINWIKLDTSDRSQESYSINLIENGIYGSQLCWKIQMTSRDAAECNPLVTMLDVSYTAIPTGAYANSSAVALGNVALYGSYELVSGTDCEEEGAGEANDQRTSLANDYIDKSMCGYPISELAYTKDLNGKMSKDYSLRGHLILRKLYDPFAEQEEDREKACTGICNRWNAGKKLMSIALNSLDTDRRLYTSGITDGKRVLKEITPKTNVSDVTQLDTDVFPAYSTRIRDSYPTNTAMCSIKDGVKAMFRLAGNRYDSEYCTWTSSSQESAVVNGNALIERNALIRWIKGIENDGNNTWARGWRLGAISHSVPAILGPPSERPNLWGAERVKYKENFQSALAERRTVAYVGTKDGFLHAFDAGNYRYDSPEDSEYVTHYGYFKGVDDAHRYGDGHELFFYIPRLSLPSMLNNMTDDNVWTERVIADASPSIADINLPLLSSGNLSKMQNNEWTRDDDHPNAGAKTALVMSGGPNSTVSFALDITKVGMGDSDAQDAPSPMWEIDLNQESVVLNNSGTVKYRSNHATPATGAELTDSGVDKNGSRHSPTVVRMSFNKNNTEATRWVAVLPTDFIPPNGKAGAVYLIDMATGRPVYVKNDGNVALTDSERNASGSRLVGFFPLEIGEGVGGEVPGVDINNDGIVDVLYVPTTKGRIYKINTRNFVEGQVPSACVLVDLNQKLRNYPDTSKGIFSSISTIVNVHKSTVQVFAGTGNNPDTPTDADDNAAKNKPGWHSWLIGIEDLYPMLNECTSTSFTYQPLAEGHSVWGGVVAAADGNSVYTATASGQSSDICFLGTGEGSGKLYQFDVGNASLTDPETGAVTNGPALSSAPTVTDVDAPIASSPLIYDKHILVVTAKGELKDLAASDTGWNNMPTIKYPSTMNQLLWEQMSDGKLIP